MNTESPNEYSNMHKKTAINCLNEDNNFIERPKYLVKKKAQIRNHKTSSNCRKRKFVREFSDIRKMKDKTKLKIQIARERANLCDCWTLQRTRMCLDRMLISNNWINKSKSLFKNDAMINRKCGVKYSIDQFYRLSWCFFKSILFRARDTYWTNN